MLLSTLYPVPATVPKLASNNTFAGVNSFNTVLTGGRVNQASYDLLSLSASISGLDIGATGMTSTGDILIGKTSAIIGIGPSTTTRMGGMANYSTTASDIGLFAENAGGQIRLRPDGRLSSTGQMIVHTDRVTYAGNDMWHAGNFTPANYLTTATAATTYVAQSGTNTLPTGDWRIRMDSTEGADTGVIRLYPGSAFSVARNAIFELNGANAPTNPSAFRLLSQGASTISAGTLSLSAPVTVTGGLTVSTGGLNVTSGGVTVAGGLNVAQGTATFAGAATFNSSAAFTGSVDINRAGATLNIGADGAGLYTGAITSYNTNGTQLGLYINQAGTIYLRPSGRLASDGQVLISATTFSYAGSAVWHAGNFNPNTKANLSGGTFTGAVGFNSAVNMNTGSIQFTQSVESHIMFNWDGYYLFNNLQNMGFYHGTGGYLMQMRKSDKYVLAADFAISSDSRIKEHLEFLSPEEQLAKLMQVQTRKYIKNGVSVEYGTYAQELIKIWPEMVTKDEAFGFSDFHTVNTNMLHATHIAATQALCIRQRTDHSELQLRVHELEHRVEAQARIIAQLTK